MASNIEDGILFLVGFYILLPVRWNYLYYVIDKLANSPSAPELFIQLSLFMKVFISLFGLLLLILALASFRRKVKDHTLFKSP